MMRAWCVVAVAGGVVAAPVIAGPPGRGHSSAPRRVVRPGGTDSFPVSENFDSFAAGTGFPCASPGPNCAGTNGWSLWTGTESSSQGVPGPNDGTISNAHAHSGANSLQMAPAVDIVQTGNITSGQWKVTVWTFVTSGTNGFASDRVYVMALNTYSPPTPPTNGNNWSALPALDRFTGMLVNADTTGAPIMPLVRDAWVPLEILIDIDADTYSVRYNNAPAYGPNSYSGGYLPGGAHALACLDLYSDDATGIFLDDVSVQPIVSCYPNCDHSTSSPCLTVQDFGCFLNAFAAGDSYANCDGSTTIPVLTVQDFGCFLNSFAAGCGTNC
jgi:hypothetical protein